MMFTGMEEQSAGGKACARQLTGDFQYHFGGFIMWRCGSLMLFLCHTLYLLSWKWRSCVAEDRRDKRENYLGER